MLSVSEARERILAVLQPVDRETVSLDRAAGRVLAADITASIDLPPFDNSSVDGFAVCAADTAPGRTLNVIADLRAGSDASVVRLQPGQAARIMTGAPVPAGTAAVIMVEDTDFNDRTPGAPAPATVTLNKDLLAGENIRRRGEDLHAGDRVLTARTVLRAQEAGLLATLGMAMVPMYRRPRLALLSCGDELLPVDAPLVPGKVRESNSYALAAQAESAGVDVIRLGVASDNEWDVHLLLERAVEAAADVIVSSAGVSVGAFDFIKPVIEANGELSFWKVNMRPGKPLAFGNYRGIPFFGLPGNPVSAFVGFEVFVRPALERLSGREVRPRPARKARLAETVESDGRESYLRAVVSEEDGRLTARLASHQGSGNIFSLVRANALLIVPSGVKCVPANSDVEIWFIP